MWAGLLRRYSFGQSVTRVATPGYANLTELGVMNVLSLYLLLGIGVDDLYIMADAFRQARHVLCISD